MLSEQAGRLIKAKRVAKGLKQEELARLAAVSRDVLSRLEQGRASAVQSDTIDRLFFALGLKMHFSEQELSRQVARLEQQRVVDQRRARHLQLAVELAATGARGRIKSAKAQVNLWRERKLCSDFYIEKWSEVLALRPKEMASAMLRFGEWEAAMFQNSPWI